MIMMNKKMYLLIFTAVISLTACSKESITLLCKAEKATHFTGDFYSPGSSFEEHEVKIYISFSEDSIGVYGGIVGESFKGISKSSESYYARTDYEEWTNMYRGGYKSRSISIDRLTLKYRIQTNFTESIGKNQGNLFEGSCSKAKQQI